MKANRPQEFTAIDGAVDWLKSHRGAVSEGQIVTILGVAFVVVLLAPEILILVPAAAVIFASSEEGRPQDCHDAEVAR